MNMKKYIITAVSPNSNERKYLGDNMVLFMCLSNARMFNDISDAEKELELAKYVWLEPMIAEIEIEIKTEIKNIIHIKK